jgi:predicted acetyltransferase
MSSPPAPALMAPSVRLHDAFLAAHHEWGPGPHEDGFGLHPEDDVETAAGFAAWVSRLTRAEDPASDPGPGDAHSTYRWMVENDQVMGGIALRHELTDAHLRALGHIGYGVRPSARRRGLGTWALGAMIAEARARGLNHLLIVCEAGNLASARTVERCGGVLEPGAETDAIRRYRIDIMR